MGELSSTSGTIIKMGTKIYNSNLTRELMDVVKIQTATDPTPTEIADKVIPVIDVNPKHARIVNLGRSVFSGAGAGNTTIYTTPTDKDFYLTGASLSCSKVVTDANNQTNITLTVNAVSFQLLKYQSTTLTVSEGNQVVSLHFPILVDKGTNIILAKGSADSSSSGSIWGYLVDNIRA